MKINGRSARVYCFRKELDQVEAMSVDLVKRHVKDGDAEQCFKAIVGKLAAEEAARKEAASKVVDIHSRGKPPLPRG